MSDLIHLMNIRAWGRHGVSELEREKPQVLLIDVQIDLDLRSASSSDSLADTVDYSFIHKRIVQTVESSSFKLLEALCAQIIAQLFEDKRILAAEVKVAKPEKLSGATPSITLRRSNQ